MSGSFWLIWKLTGALYARQQYKGVIDESDVFAGKLAALIKGEHADRAKLVPWRTIDPGIKY